MAVPYQKPPTTVDRQVEMLVERGMDVGDEEEAKRLLARVSYYRLSGYWYPFRSHGTEQLRPGTKLSTIRELYAFDRRLRLLVMEAIEQYEIALRTQITYHLTNNTGSAMCHNVAEVFSDTSRHATWLADVHKEVSRSREPYIEHFKRKYSGFPDVPLWIASETMTMRTLSDLYAHMANTPARNAVAVHFGVSQAILQSWNRFLSVVRNICAHHARLWNKELGFKAIFPTEKAWNAVRGNGRLFTILVVLRKLVGPFPFFNDWATSVEALIDPVAVQGRNFTSMGLPSLAWKTDVLWAR